MPTSCWELTPRHLAQSIATCSARITTWREKLLQQTNGHNHAVDETDSCVEQIRSNLRKRAREEVVSINFTVVPKFPFHLRLKITLITLIITL